MTVPEIGDPAPDVILRRGSARAVRLSSLWRDKPVVAVFLRHYG